MYFMLYTHKNENKKYEYISLKNTRASMREITEIIHFIFYMSILFIFKLHIFLFINFSHVYNVHIYVSNIEWDGTTTTHILIRGNITSYARNLCVTVTVVVTL